MTTTHNPARLFNLVSELKEIHEKNGVKLTDNYIFNQSLKWKGKEDELEEMIKFINREMKYNN